MLSFSLIMLGSTAQYLVRLSRRMLASTKSKDLMLDTTSDWLSFAGDAGRVLN